MIWKTNETVREREKENDIDRYRFWFESTGGFHVEVVLVGNLVRIERSFMFVLR